MQIRATLCVLGFGLIILVKRSIGSAYRPLHRDPTLKYSNFVKNANTILPDEMAVIVQRKVPKSHHCGFNCVNNPRCTSYNVAAFPDADENYECQLLATDKYVKSNSLKYSKEFNHYSIGSPCESSPCKNGGACRTDYEKQRYKCDCAPGFSGDNCGHTVTSCQDLMKVGVTEDGVYTIRPDEQGAALKVYCDQTTDGGGWTVLQRRVSPFDTSFNRNWEEYRTGFGKLTGEFWLGNDNIHRLTADPVSFRIEFQENGGNKWLHARYENFVVAGADEKYRWNMDSYSGDLSNGIYGSIHAAHRVTGMQFSTPDEDNDNNPDGNCASGGRMGWWYNWCGLTSLNSASSPHWIRTAQEPYEGISASASEMKIRSK